ncbi:hypothetical protein [Sphingomonas montana]|uniref:hypothetical protein n=1 Tax=Sphingomonas montana TaxID=1843236 RepID=UPI00096FF2E1|nr:hypothetical protein [Sphingomonas montana]
MATDPNQTPDSPPAGPDDAPDQFAPGATPKQDDPDAGQSPMEDPGSDGGTGGTGGTTGPQDHDVTS